MKVTIRNEYNNWTIQTVSTFKNMYTQFIDGIPFQEGLF